MHAIFRCLLNHNNEWPMQFKTVSNRMLLRTMLDWNYFILIFFLARKLAILEAVNQVTGRLILIISWLTIFVPNFNILVKSKENAMSLHVEV